MAPNFFRILLVLVVLYAFLRGGRDERIAGALCLVGAILSKVAVSPLAERYSEMEMGVLLVDISLLIGFVVIALRSERFWPLWIAGLQLTTLVGHFLKAMNEELFYRSYGAAIGVWSYPILLILLVGTWRSYRYRNPSDEDHAAGPLPPRTARH